MRPTELQSRLNATELAHRLFYRIGMRRGACACGGESAKELILNKKRGIFMAASNAGVPLCIYRNIGCRSMGLSKMIRTAHPPRSGNGRIVSEAGSHSRCRGDRAPRAPHQETHRNY